MMKTSLSPNVNWKCILIKLTDDRAKDGFFQGVKFFTKALRELNFGSPQNMSNLLIEAMSKKYVLLLYITARHQFFSFFLEIF